MRMDDTYRARQLRDQFLLSIGVLNMLAIILLTYRIDKTGTYRYWFLAWNLFLAWLPVIFAWQLHKRTARGLALSWQTATLFVLWLLFLPNAFYLITDFIHLRPTGEVSLVSDIVLFSVYAWCGFVLGYLALFLVHRRAVQRFGQYGHWLPVVTLLLSGFAIYLGRYLRWNSWDIVLNPLSVLFDVSDQLINPLNTRFTLGTTGLIFLLLSSLYFVLCATLRLVHGSKNDVIS